MPSDIAISARNLTKTYRLFGHPGERIKQFFSLGIKKYHQEFTALKDVSFDIKKGETIGIIGRNGSGKSTLLQLICGILKPTVGTVQVNGRVSALLELGAGFNPEFTGRENVYFQGALMGFTKEQMDERFDEIAAFANIGEFIDQPVRTYSSGMFVRLAFSAAAHVDPDVLLIDEVLSVGDIGFTMKCLNRMCHLAQHSTVILVSHNMQHISSFCTRVLVCEGGNITLDTSDSALAIDRYHNLVSHDLQISGTGAARVVSLSMKVKGDILSGQDSLIEQGAFAVVELTLVIDDTCAAAEVLLYIHDEGMSPLVCFPIQNDSSSMLLLRPGLYQLDIPLGQLDLNSGKYSFVVGIRDPETHTVFARVQGLHPFRISSESTYWGRIVRPTAPISIKS